VPCLQDRSDKLDYTVCFQQDSVCAGESIKGIKKSPEMALPCVEAEETMYCLGEKAGNGTSTPDSA